MLTGVLGSQFFDEKNGGPAALGAVLFFEKENIFQTL